MALVSTMLTRVFFVYTLYMAMLYKRQKILYQNMLQPNLLSEGVRLGLSQKKIPTG